MKEKIVTIQQIKEAKRLHRALEITSDGRPRITFAQMVERILEMDRKSASEYEVFQQAKGGQTI